MLYYRFTDPGVRAVWRLKSYAGKVNPRLHILSCCYTVWNGLNGKWHCDRLSVAVVFNSAELPKGAGKNKLLIQTNSEECTVP